MPQLEEASPICRGKNLSWETILLFYNSMPREALPKVRFQAITESKIIGWSQTHSQIARQLAFYYEEEGICYPRFTKETSYKDLFSYMQNWAAKYFIPNPYSPSLKDFTPTCIYASVVEAIKAGQSDFDTILDSIFGVQLSSHDKVKVYLSNFTDLVFDKKEVSISNRTVGVDTVKNPDSEYATDAKKYYEYFSLPTEVIENESRNTYEKRPSRQFFNGFHSVYRPYITAIKSKPFLLLAGISGTGKSRIVRELARACWNVDSNEYKAPKPRNFEMVQVKPNWHDSSELIGYVSRIDGERYVVGPFLKFLVKAMKEPDVPYFLCLDEMNLAPVEQYFAEYLSVVESRKCDGETVVTDPIIEYEATDAYKSLIDQLFYDDEETRLEMLKEEDGLRLTIPQNLIVVGTVNMDETTFSFSRKVLDRAMTIEMNEVDLKGGLSTRYEQIGKLGNKELVGTAVEGVDVYSQYQSVCDTAISYLQSVNDVLEGTPFKVAYRTRNEVLLYVVNNLPYSKDADGKDLPQEYVIARALDEITNMKILSRIEGDETKVTPHFLEELGKTIKEGLEHIFEGLFDKTASDDAYNSVSLTKLDEMTKRLSSGYTSFWS